MAFIKKISGGLGALKLAWTVAPLETLIMMYKALVQPYFDYCSSVWEGMGKCQSERLQKLQNRAARIVTYSDFDTRSLRLLDDLGWDTLEQRRAKPHRPYAKRRVLIFIVHKHE